MKHSKRPEEFTGLIKIIEEIKDLPFEKLVEELIKLPSVGTRTAERLAFYILSSPKSYVKSLAEAITNVKEKVGYCSICNNLTEQGNELCHICNNSKRDKSVVCVVENPKDISTIESTHSFNGIYHVLLGAFNPLEGIGPGDLTTDALLKRLELEEVGRQRLSAEFWVRM